MKTKLLLALIALIFTSPIFGQGGTAKRVAILETVDKEGKAPYIVKLMVRSKLSTVIKDVPGYEGYDRVDIASILGEHDFQRTGLVSDRDIKRLGEMTGADYVLVAEVAYLNDSYIFLSAKILNVETARVERTADTQTTVDDLERNCKILAGKLLNVNIATGAVKGDLIIDGNRYVGEHKDGKPNGTGIIYYASDDSVGRKSYEGSWVNGKCEGKGTMIWKDGNRYIGECKNSAREGYGTQYDSDGEIYEGYWLNDKRHGKGKITYASNDSAGRKSYDGDWYYGTRQGIGTMIWNDGEKYVGNWVNGEREGNGILYYTSGNRVEGIFKNGRISGRATYYYDKGNYMIGYYVYGKKDGDWKYYDKNGKYKWTKVYKNGIYKRNK